MTCYVETSALLRRLLENQLEAMAGVEKVVTSALTRLEAERALVRARWAGRIDEAASARLIGAVDRFLSASDVMAVDDQVLAKAGQVFPAEPIRALDALHLASALVWRERRNVLAVVSCDDRIRENARALGFVVLPEGA